MFLRILNWFHYKKNGYPLPEYICSLFIKNFEPEKKLNRTQTVAFEYGLCLLSIDLIAHKHNITRERIRQMLLKFVRDNEKT